MVSYKSLFVLLLSGLACAIPDCDGQPASGQPESADLTPKASNGHTGELIKSESHSKHASNSPPTPPAPHPKPENGGATGGTGNTPANGGKSPGAPSGSIKATFTVYGSGDNNGSGWCVKSQACGIYGKQGYTAAISQNLYGAGPGGGNGPQCGSCWKITVTESYDGSPLKGGPTNAIVLADNLCPAQGNPLCSQPDLHTPNNSGGIVNFDLCMDSGANKVFQNAGVGMGRGYVEKVGCDQWHGQVAGQLWHQ